MDTSKKRIDMCEEAWEIQEGWQPSDWDCVYCKREKKVVVLSGYSTDGGYYGHETPSPDTVSYYSGSCDDLSQGKAYKEFHIWLPYQDQLQEMLVFKSLGAVSKLMTKPQLLIHAIGNSLCFSGLGTPTEYSSQFSSMEQLWLCFVMREKFNKEWRDDTWKKVS